VAGSGDSQSAGTIDAVRAQLDARLGVRTGTVDPQRIAHFSDRIAADPSLLTIVAPLVGILARFGAGAGV